MFRVREVFGRGRRRCAKLGRGALVASIVLGGASAAQRGGPGGSTAPAGPASPAALFSARDAFRHGLEDWLAARAALDDALAASLETTLETLAAILCADEGIATPRAVLGRYRAMSVEEVRRDLAGLERARAGEAALARGDDERARGEFVASLTAFRALGDDYRSVQAARRLASLAERGARFAEASVWIEEVLVGARLILSERAEEEALAHLAALRALEGEDDFGRPLRQAIAMARSRGDRAAEAGHRVALGRLFLVRRDLGRAAEELTAALSLRESAGDGRAEVLALLGQVRLEEMDFALAEVALREAADALAHDPGRFPLVEAEVFLGLARVALWGGRLVEAERRTQDAIRLAIDRHPALAASGLIVAGRVFATQGRREEAMGAFRDAARLARQVRDVETEVAARVNAIRCAAAADGEPPVRAELLELLADERLPPQSPAALAARIQVALGAFRGGDYAEAETRAKEAIVAAETTLRLAPAGPALDFAFLPSSAMRAFEVAIAAVLARDRGRAAEAFALAERSKARAFLVELERFGIPVEADAPEELRRPRERALARIAALGGRPPDRLDAVSLEARRAGLVDAYRELQVASAALQQDARNRGIAPRPASIESARALVGPRRALLEYFVGEETSWLFFVDATDLLVFPLPGAAELTRRVEVFSALLRRSPLVPQARAKLASAGASLASLLVPPELLPRLEGREVYVIPDGPLYFVPFEALPSSGAEREPERPLGDRAVLAYGPSAGILIALAERPVRLDRGLVAAANPESPGVPALPGGENEARAVAALFPADRSVVVTGAAFQRDALLAAPAQSGVLHVSAHTVTRPDGRVGILASPSGSGDDGIVWSDEVVRVARLPDLVVLSGCETGRGLVPPPGLGVRGLVLQFVFGGASRVVVSLWPVEEDAGRDLVVRFYRELLAGSSVPAALSTAARSSRDEVGGRWSLASTAFVAYGPF